MSTDYHSDRLTCGRPDVNREGWTIAEKIAVIAVWSMNVVHVIQDTLHRDRAAGQTDGLYILNDWA